MTKRVNTLHDNDKSNEYELYTMQKEHTITIQCHIL